VNDIPDAENGFTLFFSTSPFPNARELERVGNEAGGNWYRHCDSGLEGWLCPALFLYFNVAPERLYVAAAPRGPKFLPAMVGGH
jgi:hypothetical protein